MESAHRRIAKAVKDGLLPKATHWKCTDCDSQAAAYDHWHGYTTETALDVQPVCNRCNTLRGYVRKREWREVVVQAQIREREARLAASYRGGPVSGGV